jgi:hypothetical protein
MPHLPEPRHVLTALICSLSLLRGTPVAGQNTQNAAVSLEALAADATRAVVLIDVETASDTRQGSGFLVDPTGIILTNEHVVRDARSARVKLSSGDVYDRVAILAIDNRRDIAVLKISGFDLPVLPLGNSDSVRIGASVVLIGSPLGLENTVSTGVVSGRRQEPEGFQLLQVTAPASNGSSGGPVLNTNGDVVGMASSQVGVGQNLNFAVPINYARGMLQGVGQDEPIVLQPTSAAVAAGAPPVATRASSNAVNIGLNFDAADLRTWVIESTESLREGSERRTRVTYRVIETVGITPRRIERYLESETTQRTEPFGTFQTVRRERVRSLVAAEGLRPISSRGDISSWTEEGWQTSRHDVRFEGDRALGVIIDPTGRSMELDRALPRGIILREVRDLAFATLAVDSLIGRSVEFATFDARTGEMASDRYDVLGTDNIDVAGQREPVLRVNVASDLINETVFFMRERPRIAVGRMSEDGARVEEVTRIDPP